MRLSKPGYYADFVAYPVLIVVLSGVAVWMTTSLTRLVWSLLCAVVGVLTWSLLEYLMHRYVLHRVPIMVQMHDMHHENPSAMVGSPTWLSVGVGAVLFAALWWASSFDIASGFMVGLMLGYLWYVTLHHGVHHWRLEPGSWLYGAKLRHIHHHYAEHDGNFGVSTSFWDRVFGTAIDHRPRQRAGIASRSA